jgi:Carboxypeptidase regulatory-like domain
VGVSRAGSKVLILALAFAVATAAFASPQSQTPTSAPDSKTQTGEANLIISIRLVDDSPFSGAANLHVVNLQGSEVGGTKSESEGDTLFKNLPPGHYSIEAGAAGFSSAKETVDIEAGKHSQTVFLIMTPKPALAAANSSDLKTAAAPPPAANVSWAPPGVDAFIPPVAPGVSCSLPLVLNGASHRMTEFVANLQKFSATERLEHYPISDTGKRLVPQTRSFDYFAQITSLEGGLFSVEEYRNGSVDRSRFPAGVATEGLPAMALIFHPLLAPDFDFACEGLGSWQDRPAWQVHFVQLTDRPSRIGGYRTLEHYYPFYLKGRAWIDAGTYQVLRLETELAKPITAVGLTEDLLIINYGTVTFHTHKQQLWLPQSAEMYMERHGRRFYRVHTFTDFRVFEVNADQNIHAPKESYCFTNTSDHDIAGILTVSPVSGLSLKAVSIQFTIPPGGSIYKVVGPGKDVSMPVAEVGAATFVHNGPAGSIKADAYLVKESTLDVIADSPVSFSQ